MRTTTERPLRRLVTRTRVPIRNVRCAAVSWCMSKRSPDAVGPPCCSRPYHDALPSCRFPDGRAEGDDDVTLTVERTGGASPAHAARLTASSSQRLRSQLMSRGSVAQLFTPLLAVSLAE